MSYSYDDFFMEHVYPEMKKLFGQSPLEEGFTSEKFLDILRRAMDQDNIRNYLLANRLLDIAIDPHQENLSIDKVVQKCAQIFSIDEVELRKIEYSDGPSIISVNYQGMTEEEDLRKK